MIRTNGARLCDLGELERVKIIFDVNRGLFERDLAKEGVRRRRRGGRLQSGETTGSIVQFFTYAFSFSLRRGIC